MDPTQLPVHDDTTIAMLFGAILAVVKLVEKGMPWLMNKKKASANGVHERGTTVVQLDPVASQAIAEILGRVKNIEEVVDRRDGDGTPLVYYSRKDQQRLQDDIQEIHEGVRLLARSAKS